MTPPGNRPSLVTLFVPLLFLTLSCACYSGRVKVLEDDLNKCRAENERAGAVSTDTRDVSVDAGEDAPKAQVERLENMLAEAKRQYEECRAGGVKAPDEAANKLRNELDRLQAKLKATESRSEELIKFLARANADKEVLQRQVEEMNKRLKRDKRSQF